MVSFSGHDDNQSTALFVTGQMYAHRHATEVLDE